MKYKFLKFSLAGLLFAVSGFFNIANSTLIDFGTYTTDTSTGLQWLDLTATTGQSYNSILGGFGGYSADGYKHATLTQLCGLWGNIGANIPDCLSSKFEVVESISQTTADLVTDLFGATFSGDNTIGLYNDESLRNERVGLACVNNSQVACLPNITPPTFLRSINRIHPDVTSMFLGHWMVRSVQYVPEPSTFVIFALSIIALVSRRFKKQS